MSKHTRGDLQQMQSLPLRIKVTMTERRIFDWYQHFGGDVYLSFSGGKDSTVLKHIVDNVSSVKNEERKSVLTESVNRVKTMKEAKGGKSNGNKESRNRRRKAEGDEG